MKKKYYLTLDTETCTLPFANEMCKNADEKKKIAIAKPIVYDIGWVITDRQGQIVKKVNYLVQETFFVPNVFNTAYYKSKRPLYIEKLNKGQITSKLWNEIVTELEFDLKNVDLSCAYNACFDFKKAIPFTERYINALYSENYQKWEDEQKRRCENLLDGSDDSKNENYLKPFFELRDEKYPIADLWGVSVDKLINFNRYKKFCFENDLFTNSGIYFKTSAESSFQYIMKDKNFIEEHTALSDAIIESILLTKALKKGKIEPSIEEFPFKNLGNTYDYALDKKNKEYIDKVADKIYNYYLKYTSNNCSNCWVGRLENILADLGV